MSHEFPLGRREPPTRVHEVRYGFAALGLATVDVVEEVLPLPWWHWLHDQHEEGSCVGHGVVMERAIANSLQARRESGRTKTFRYDPIGPWNRGKARDPWPDTNPGDGQGTSVDAVYSDVKDNGLCRVRTMKIKDGLVVPVGLGAADVSAGVETFRWARTVDEMRTGLSEGLAIAIGVDWYTSFDRRQLIQRGRETHITDSLQSLGSVRGGHCVCVYGASDRREAFKLKNSWGRSYPLVWLPYAVMQKLLDDGGEAALVTDR